MHFYTQRQQIPLRFEWTLMLAVIFPTQPLNHVSIHGPFQNVAKDLDLQLIIDVSGYDTSVIVLSNQQTLLEIPGTLSIL